MTTTATTSAALVLAEPAFSGQERLALAGFLAGYSGLTRDAYGLDLRQFTAWCRSRQLRLFAVRRADIELFARELENAGRAGATVTRRLSTIAGLYKYAVEENLLDTPRRRTSAGPAWTTSPMPPDWTVTRSAPCSSPRGSDRPPSTR